MTRYYTNDQTPSTADEFDAEVIAAFGRHLLVRTRHAGAARPARGPPARASFAAIACAASSTARTTKC